MMSDLNMSHRKMSCFVSLPLFGFTLIIKLRHFDSERNWNNLIFFDKKNMTSDLNMSSFPLFVFTLVIKLRNFHFESSHWNTLTLSWRRPSSYRNQSIDLPRQSDVRLEYVKQWLIWFKHHCLSKISTISSEIRIFFVLFTFFCITMEIVSN